MSDKIYIDNCSLSVSVKQDGVWLHFESCNPPHFASINVEQLAEKYRIDEGRSMGVIGKALLNWCHDRRQSPPKQEEP